MKNIFVVEQKPLLSILSSMQPICTKRTAVDTTTSILFQIGHKELVLKSTDLEISLQASYVLKQSDIQEQKSFLVSGRRIFDLVKELEGDIECSLIDQQLHLKSNNVNLALNIKDAQEFPPFPERIENLMQMEASFLLEMFNKVAFLIPQNNANNSLNGLYCEISNKELKMTTTDGHCLAQVKTTAYTLEEPKQWLLPRRAIFEMKKILEGYGSATIFLGICENQLVFSGELFNFFTKLLNESFPEYAAILDKNDFSSVQVDRSHFIKTLRRSSCLLSGQFIATSFEFASDVLKVSIQNKEVGKLQESIPLFGFTGDNLNIQFYAPYLLSGLPVFNDDIITFYLKNSFKPIIFESNSEKHSMIYLVMPVSSVHKVANES